MRSRIKSLNTLKVNKAAQYEKQGIEVLRSETIVEENRTYKLYLMCRTCNTSFVKTFHPNDKTGDICPCCEFINIAGLLTSQGRTLLYDSDSSFHFKCNNCNYRGVLKRQAITRPLSVCMGCKIEQGIQRIKSSCYKIESIDGYSFVLVCKGCKSTRNIKNLGVLNRIVLCCGNCGKRKAPLHKVPIGFNLISEGDGYTISACKECGYWRRTDIHDAHDKSRCINCKYLKFSKILSRDNCIPLTYDDTNKRVGVEFPCGAIKDLPVDLVIDKTRGSLSVATWDAETSVYLIVLTYNDNIYCKIGTAIDPKQRARDLKLSGDYFILQLGRFSSRTEADKIEKLFHKALAQYRLDSQIPSLFSGRVIKRRGTVDGTTEWFTGNVICNIRKIMSDVYRCANLTN